MVHQMKLIEEMFEKIKNKEKKVEIRLFDEKRQKIKEGDIIIFSKLPKLNETLKVKVFNLKKFNTFKEMFKTLPKDIYGYKDISLEKFLSMIYEIYSIKQEKKYGVLVIEISNL
ncbi:isomerase [Tepiditoga spiralis]|uniref:Isomerase n=1 Tax=Tepiditoga spiralis TaxID=2108365 RepID=A0A7G1G5J3_9BACT|nr:ASCH domain-containing protein [Tepiditoga spiralis]BBE30304.1 isomerase [Tepiditoga spiralis]